MIFRHVLQEKYKQINKYELDWNSGDLEVTEYLVKKGSDIGSKTKDGKTALDVAIEAGNVKFSCLFTNIRVTSKLC